VQRRRDEHGDWDSSLYEILLDDTGVFSQTATPPPTDGTQVFPERETRGVPLEGTLTDHSFNRPLNIHTRRSARERVDVKESATSQFETFWRIYPSRDPHPNPKKPARLKFEAVIKAGVDLAIIIRGVENYAAFIRESGTEPRYVAQAVTWLGQERWKDHQASPELRRVRVGML
jgi:hypothetical protein